MLSTHYQAYNRQWCNTSWLHLPLSAYWVKLSLNYTSHHYVDEDNLLVQHVLNSDWRHLARTPQSLGTAVLGHQTYAEKKEAKPWILKPPSETKDPPEKVLAETQQGMKTKRSATKRDCTTEFSQDFFSVNSKQRYTVIYFFDNTDTDKAFPLTWTGASLLPGLHHYSWVHTCNIKSTQVHKYTSMPRLQVHAYQAITAVKWKSNSYSPIIAHSCKLLYCHRVSTAVTNLSIMQAGRMNYSVSIVTCQPHGTACDFTLP